MAVGSWSARAMIVAAATAGGCSSSRALCDDRLRARPVAAVGERAQPSGLVVRATVVRWSVEHGVPALLRRGAFVVASDDAGARIALDRPPATARP